jgi:hypothetical protein
MKTSNLEEKLKFPILGELNPPKNQTIPWRNQGIANGKTWVALTVSLEKWRVKRSEEVSSVRGGLKCENRTVQFCLNRQKHPLIVQAFFKEI